MYHLIVLQTAQDHALEAGIYYEEQQEGLGLRFLSELEIAYEKIIQHPQYYSFIDTQNIYRDIALTNFPFTVVYEVVNNDILVIDVFNTNRENTPR